MQDIKSRDSYMKSFVVSLDWSESRVSNENLSNISLYFFPISGGEPYLKLSGDIKSVELYLPHDTYSVLIFNGVASGVGNNQFLENNYRDFNVQLINNEVASHFNVSDNVIDIGLLEPNPLAVWSLDEVEITKDMNEDIFKDIKPQPITTTKYINVRIENLINAQNVEAKIVGVPNKIFLHNGERDFVEKTLYSHSFQFEKREFDNPDNPINGVVSHKILSYGKHPDPNNEYKIIFNVIIGSGELVSYTRDITDQINAGTNLDIPIKLLDSANKIILPKGVAETFYVTEWNEIREIIF